MTTNRILAAAILLLPLAITVFMGINLFIESRKHKRIMQLMDQADAVNKQVLDAIAKGDMESARFHHERYMELKEHILVELKKRR